MSGTKVLWEASDEISILWDGGSTMATASSAGAEATFTAEVDDASTYYAVYPSSLGAVLSSDQLSFSVPSAQHGTFAEANPAAAKTQNSTLNFKNIGAVGKITLGRSDIAEIRVSSNEGSDIIAGDVVVSFDGENLPLIDASSATGTEIVLTPSSGSAFAPGDLYFSVIPCTMQSGIIFRLTTSGGDSLPVKNSYQSAAFKRSTVLSFGTIDGAAPTVEGYSMPIALIMKPTAAQLATKGGTRALMDAGTAIANAVQSGNRLTFTGGATIEKTGDPVDMRLWCPNHVQPANAYAGFQLGLASPNWTGGDSWLLKVPMKEALSGDLRLFYGSRREAQYGETSYFWSSDYGVTWNEVTGKEAGASDGVWKSLDFTIPISSAVPAGGQFWFRVTFSGDVNAANVSTYVCLANGFVILPQTAELSSLPAAGSTVGGAEVLFSEGFDDLVGTKDGYIDFDGYFFRSLTTGTYSSPSYTSSNVTLPTGVTPVNCHSRPGFLQVGFADEAIPSNNAVGRYSIDLSSYIQAEGWAGADLTVSFKAAGITTAYYENVDAQPVLSASSGTLADGTLSNLPMDSWKEYNFTVTGMSAAHAVLSLTSAVETYGVSGVPDNRFFIDDIVITATESEGVEVPEYKDLELTFMLNNGSFDSLAAAIAYVNNAANSDYPRATFTMADKAESGTYEWVLYNGNATNFSYSASNFLVLNAACYLGTPVIANAKLKSLTFTQGAKTQASRKATLCTATHKGALKYEYYDASVEGDGAAVVTSGKDTDYTFTVKDPVVGARYYLVCCSAGIGVSKVVLTYSVPKSD